jgi:hypothetical protein
MYGFTYETLSDAYLTSKSTMAFSAKADEPCTGSAAPTTATPTLTPAMVDGPASPLLPL